MIKRIVHTAVLICWCLSAVAQNYVLQHYTRQDGLPHNNVFRTFQDSKGFIWLCTYGGLSRFDGKSFYHYEEEFTNTPILCISEPMQGMLLACSYTHGLFTVKNGKPARFVLPAGNLPEHIIYATKSRNTIWLIAKTGDQLLYRIYKGRVKEVAIKGENGKKVTFNKIIRSNENLLITTNNGVYEVNDTSVTRLFSTLIKEEVVDIRKSPEGTFWIACKNKIVAIENGNVLHSFDIPNRKTINNILIDNKGSVWISLLEEGVLRIANDKLADMTSGLAITGTIINDLYEDNEGNIWIATYTDGLFRLNTLGIMSYVHTNSPLTMYCSSITRLDSARFLIGSSGKVNIWDKGLIRPLPVALLKAGHFINFLEHVNNKLYIGTANGMIEKNLSFPYRERLVLSNKKSDPVFGTLCFFQDSEKRIWVGGYAALFRLIGGKLVMQTHPSLKRRFNTIHEDAYGNTLFGTDSGMMVYNGQNFSFRYFGKRQATNNISSIYSDSDKRLWIATLGGLVCVEQSSYKVIPVGKGFLNNRCKEIISDGKGGLLVSTHNGLVKLNTKTLELTDLPTGSNQGEILKLFVADSNQLFIGNTAGLFTINTNVLPKYNALPAVYITTVKTEDNEVYMPDTLYLDFRKTRLTIEFIALNYRNPNSINYRYRIKGNDYTNDNWRYTQNTSIEIPSLQPGDYELYISARNSHESWSRTASLAIHVPAPFWKERWFLFSMLLSAAVILLLITRWIILKTERKKRERLAVYNKMVYLKQQALGALMNPHFIFNCMNSIQHFLNKNENTLANSYLADFSHLIRMTLEDAQAAFIPLDKELERINRYLSLEQLRFGEDLTYSLSIDPSLQTQSVHIPNMILQPYIENAIWHGIMPKNKPGCIKISFAKEKNAGMKITIEDDGVGLDFKTRKNKSQQHWGLKLTQERLALLQALLHQYYEVMLHSKPNGTGTIVTITLPLNPDANIFARMENEITGNIPI